MNTSQRNDPQAKRDSLAAENTAHDERVREAVDAVPDGLTLTKKQRAVIDLIAKAERDGEVPCEGDVANELWPLITRPRIVCSALENKGLVLFGHWISDEWGHDLHLTDEALTYTSTTSEEQR